MLAFLEADSGYELSKEYEELKKFSAINTYEAAKKEENQEKNRYLDILPCKHACMDGLKLIYDILIVFIIL